MLINTFIFYLLSIIDIIITIYFLKIVYNIRLLKKKDKIKHKKYKINMRNRMIPRIFKIFVFIFLLLYLLGMLRVIMRLNFNDYEVGMFFLLFALDVILGVLNIIFVKIKFKRLNENEKEDYFNQNYAKLLYLLSYFLIVSVAIIFWFDI